MPEHKVAAAIPQFSLLSFGSNFQSQRVLICIAVDNVHNVGKRLKSAKKY